METVDHPEHYQQCAAETTPIVRLLGISNVQLEQEANEVNEELGLNHRLATAVEYLWRAGKKSRPFTCEHCGGQNNVKVSRENDLEKARWWIQREINFGGKRLELERAIELIDALLEGAKK
jgi:hypothetical protein